LEENNAEWEEAMNWDFQEYLKRKNHYNGFLKHDNQEKEFEEQYDFCQEEKNLMFAILIQAIEDIESDKHNRCKSKNDEERYWKGQAIRWIRSNNKKFMSFVWYCNLLNINAKGLRNAMNFKLARRKKWRQDD